MTDQVPSPVDWLVHVLGCDDLLPAVDPHAAAESEVAAMARELLAARARIAEMESERAAATEAAQETGAYLFVFDRARASVEHIVTTDAWRDKLSTKDRASLVEQLDTAMRAGMEPGIANAVVAGSVLAGRARFAELEKRVAELEGERARLVEGVASTVRRFSATLDERDALRARVAELEDQIAWLRAEFTDLPECPKES